MLEEVLLDVVLQSHQELARSKAICNICHTRYVWRPSRSNVYLRIHTQLRLWYVGQSSSWWICIDPSQVHVPGQSGSVQDSSSARPSPPDGTKALDGNTAGTGTNTPTNGTVYYDCTNCGRQVCDMYGCRSRHGLTQLHFRFPLIGLPLI